MTFNAAMSQADTVGTDDPHIIDWASGKGPETDLGKRRLKSLKKKKKKRR